MLKDNKMKLHRIDELRVTSQRFCATLWFEYEGWTERKLYHFKKRALDLINFVSKNGIRNEWKWKRSANVQNDENKRAEFHFKWPANRIRFHFLKMAENKSQSHCVYFIDPSHAPRLLCFHPFIRLTVREDRIIYIDKIPPQKIHTESHVFVCSAMLRIHKFQVNRFRGFCAEKKSCI